jgi:hypothetical protein
MELLGVDTYETPVMIMKTDAEGNSHAEVLGSISTYCWFCQIAFFVAFFNPSIYMLKENM